MVPPDEPPSTASLSLHLKVLMQLGTPCLTTSTPLVLQLTANKTAQLVIGKHRKGTASNKPCCFVVAQVLAATFWSKTLGSRCMLWSPRKALSSVGRSTTLTKYKAWAQVTCTESGHLKLQYDMA
jgi:hypothetical protein